MNRFITALGKLTLTVALFAATASIGLGGMAQQAATVTPTPSPSPTATAGANVCTALVRAAMESTDSQCGDTSRNQACYGHILNVAEFRAGREFAFESQGDKAALDQIQRLDLSPLDLELEQWGVVLMQAQANLPDQLPGQNVTFILFGDIEVENAVGDPVEIDARLTEAASIRIAPGSTRAVIANLTAQSAIFASGKYLNAAGELWVRVGQSANTEAFGWVEAEKIETDLDLLPDINPNDDVFNPMQAFYFKSGIGQPQCVEAPRDGMIVQTPRGAGKIDFTINGIDVKLGSTAYITSPEDFANTCVSLLVGEAELESDDVTKILQPGQRSCVALDENGVATGAPSEPDSFDPEEVALIRAVLDILPDDVEIPDPAPSNTPTSTNTRRPPTSTPTATETPTFTPLPPVNTAVPTKRPTRTPSIVPPTVAPTAIPPMATDTLVPPTATETPVPPVAGFSYTISAMSFTFTDTSANAPDSWSWDFGDGQTASGPNTAHTYPYPGSAGSVDYVITLTACNGGGCDTETLSLSLPNCNFDTAIPKTVDIIPSSGMCYGESYSIITKDSFCNPAGTAATVDFFTTGSFTINGFEGLHVFVQDDTTSTVVASQPLNGSGPFSFTVGTNDCS